jgi:hypothetical protein
VGHGRVCLFVIRDLKPETWKNSCAARNLDPRSGVLFPDWCKKIEHFLQSGETFKVGAPADLYALLPSMWDSMTPVEKHKVVSTVEHHDAQFTVELCKAVYTECRIPFKEQNSLRVCYHLVNTHPEQLLMMDTPHCHMICSEDYVVLMAEVAPAMERAACGLNTFLRKPST